MSTSQALGTQARTMLPQSSQTGQWLRSMALSTEIQQRCTPCLLMWPAGVSGFWDSKFRFLSRQLVPKASPRGLPSLKMLEQGPH